MVPSPPVQKKVKVRPRFFIFLAFFVGLIVLLFVLIQNMGKGKRYATALVEPMGEGNIYQGEVVIVRDEQLVDAESITRIDFVADEGSLVYKGNVICQVYSAGYNQTEINRLETVRSSIKQFHKQQMESTLLDTQLDTINEDIASYALEVRKIVQGEGAGSLGNLEQQLSMSLTERQVYLQQKYPDNQNLTSLYDEENRQLRKIESWTSTYTAQEETIVSFYTDGYESTINLNTFDDITPQEARQVLAGIKPEGDAVSRGRRALYRTIAPDHWSVLLLSKEGDWSPMVGQVFNMQLDGYADFMVQATVRSSVLAGSDLLVRMDVEGSVYPVLNIRANRAVIGETLTGLKVPIGALFVQGEMVGVVTNDGGTETFVPVQIYNRTDQYAVVIPIYQNSLQVGQYVNLYQ